MKYIDFRFEFDFSKFDFVRTFETDTVYFKNFWRKNIELLDKYLFVVSRRRIFPIPINYCNYLVIHDINFKMLYPVYLFQYVFIDCSRTSEIRSFIFTLRTNRYFIKDETFQDLFFPCVTKHLLRYRIFQDFYCPMTLNTFH